MESARQGKKVLSSSLAFSINIGLIYLSCTKIIGHFYSLRSALP